MTKKNSSSLYDGTCYHQTMKPDYHGRGIVNLMSTLARAVGVTSPYPVLSGEDLTGIEESKNIVLMVVDGLGYNYLRENGKNTTLFNSLKGSMSSVFPPSTATAISTYFTGLAPQQHAVTGWWVYLRELGIVSRVLPFVNAVDWNVIQTPISNIIDVKPLLHGMSRKHHIILGESIIDSVYSRHMAGEADLHGYTTLDDFFKLIRTAITSSNEEKLVYAYWPEFDEISHLLGVNSEDSKTHLHVFDEMLAQFMETIQDTDTTLVISSDHGFNDVPRENLICTGDHPRLADTLVLPLCGDTRVTYCYVRLSEVERFEKYVSDELGTSCELQRSKDLIDEGWFGLYEMNPKLSSRVGDYTLLFKEGYGMLNSYPGVEPPSLLGHHGGTTEDEMLVPLVIMRP